MRRIRLTARRVSQPTKVSQLSIVTAFKRTGTRLCIMLAAIICALSPSFAQSNFYSDVADDGFGGRPPVTVNRLADEPVSRQSEPRRMLLIANGQFVRGGYSLAEIPGPPGDTLGSAQIQTPALFNDDSARGLVPSAPDRPPSN